MRRIVSGREAGMGLVVMGARIDARIVTEACYEYRSLRGFVILWDSEISCSGGVM